MDTITDSQGQGGSRPTMGRPSPWLTVNEAGEEPKT